MKAIPEPSKRRLVMLERLLSDYAEKTVTSAELSLLTGWSQASIRRDISLLDIRCGASNGYRTSELSEALKGIVSSKPENRCCLVGLGRMGQMLLDAEELENSAFTLVAGFDSSVNRTEILHSVFPLHPTTMLEQVIQSEKIEYAILTVPACEAQKITNRLCKCAIKGIVNYTPQVLTVPPTVAVENVSLLTALEILSAKNIN